MGDSFVYVPGAYWVDNPGLHSTSVSIEQVVKRSNEADMVALVHPIWWVMKRSVRSDLDSLVSRCTTTTLKEQIQLLIENSKRQ